MFGSVASEGYVFRGLDPRWYRALYVLLACAICLGGCAAFIVPARDKDLSADEARWVMEHHFRIQASDGFDLVRMRRSECPALAGGCAYEGSYVAPADRFPDSRLIFTDSTERSSTYRAPRKATCAELKVQPNGNAWKFDCGNAVDIQVDAPYGPRLGYIAVVRDSEFVTIYVYRASH